MDNVEPGVRALESRLDTFWHDLLTSVSRENPAQRILEANTKQAALRQPSSELGLPTAGTSSKELTYKVCMEQMHEQLLREDPYFHSVSFNSLFCYFDFFLCEITMLSTHIATCIWMEL